jgi:hypothetical protein
VDEEEALEVVSLVKQGMASWHLRRQNVCWRCVSLSGLRRGRKEGRKEILYPEAACMHSVGFGTIHISWRGSKGNQKGFFPYLNLLRNKVQVLEVKHRRFCKTGKAPKSRDGVRNCLPLHGAIRCTWEPESELRSTRQTQYVPVYVKRKDL